MMQYAEAHSGRGVEEIAQAINDYLFFHPKETVDCLSLIKDEKRVNAVVVYNRESVRENK